MWKDNSSIQTKFLNKMILIVFASIGLWSLIWIQGEYSVFKSESDSLRTEHIKDQKSMLKKEVASVVKYINDMKKLSEQKFEFALKERVDEAHKIAMNIYQQNIDSKDLPEIKKMIKDALRPIRFNGGRGYYFAVSMEGVEQLYPVRPEFEGKNMMGLQDSKGNFVIQDEIKIIKRKSEGFVKHYWAKPDKDPSITYPKISFVKYFKSIDWYFGAGDYLDDYEKQIKAEVLNRIVELRFETEGYFFGSTFKGESLFSNGKITRGDGSIWNLTDPNGVKIIQEQKKAVENPEGGFVYYSWNKLNTSVPSPKISFVQGIPEWKWTIGAGVYLDTIEKTISKNKAALNNGVKNKLTRSVLILAVLLCLIYFWSNRISNQIQKSIETFSLFLKKTSVDSITINPDDLQLKEFKEIAVLTNKMLMGRKKAETALLKSEKQFQNLFNSITDLIYTQDMEGRFTSANPVIQNFFGYDMDDFLGRKASDFMEPEFQSDFNSRYLEVVKNQGYHESIACYFKKNKEKIYLEYKSFLVKPDDGGEPYITGIGRDVTEKILSKKRLEKLEKQIIQTQKLEAIGTLAGGIAHDFNNILFPVLGHTEMLLEDIPEDSPFHTSLNQIYTGAIRARDLVKQILAFSRQEKSELKLMKIQYLIKEVLKLIRSSIPTTIEIKQDIQADCGVIKADPMQIHQVIMNLTTNAYHAMEETGGKLKVSLNQVQLGEFDLITPDMEPGSYACLSVTDTGIGMEKNITDQIFNPFFTTKKQGKGTGMGLSVVHGIVKSMGGAIQVYSEPGKGTKFHVYFPIEKNSFEELNIQTEELIQPGDERILLVDDEEAIITMEKQMLDRLGYQVTSRTSSIEALEAFRANPDKFDMVITDMAMPNMPGDKLAVELTKIRADIPILLCTGFSETMSEEKAASLGIKGFILKPIVMKNLSLKIREVLDKKTISSD
ncbi:MAG: cache domain-containing protein [Desulfobacula sp.]|uniref:cache domain-containing protein n=1 Tax=Desulfobacula sp. TaxID=2593537 RepID=UPI0025BA03AA|nr:cache domain-containing protein [Desulfobacula sp.]MCD4720227.1 cache domain-containing protein [Desulfobacula sp.]